MPQKTDLNVSPYHDDYDEEKNFHKILFQPKQVVQARELTQLQSILQNQVERFGDAIFQSGTVVKGCAFKYDNAYNYVKVRDTRVNLDTNVVSELVGLIVKDEVSGLTAIVVNAEDGYETQNPNTKTIYVKYMNTGTSQKKEFSADDTLTFYNTEDEEQTNLAVKVLPTTLDGNPTNPVGSGYAFSVGDGVVYQNGYFVRVEEGTSAIISKYTNVPSDVVVGFETLETIVTEYADPSLYDNSQGFSNENAPGAHRLKLTPTLVTYAVGEEPDNNFLVLAEWKNGEVVRENQNSLYSGLGQEFARRTAEESGDYVVNPFIFTTADIPSNTTHLSLQTTQGLAYVNGYRVEKKNNLSVPVRKAIDTKMALGQNIIPNFGHYIIVQEMLGYLEPNKVQTISLRDTPVGRMTNADYTNLTAPGNEIGTARLVSWILSSGSHGQHATRWRLYITDIKMNSGKSFQDVRAFSAASGTAVGDTYLENGKAVLKEPTYAPLISQLGQEAVKTLRNGANNNTYHTYTSTTTAYKFSTAGTTGPITLTGGTTFPLTVGTLSDSQEAGFIVTGLSHIGVTAPAKTGTVSVTNNTSNVVGSGTSFSNEYEIGDYIYIGTLNARRIVNIANSTFMEVYPPFVTGGVTANTHIKGYPANVQIPFNSRQSSIVATNSSSVTMQLKAANGMSETLSANINLAITYFARKAQAVQRAKTVLKSVYVKIDCSNNAGTTVGPWSLGLPDVYKLEGVYVSTGYTESEANNKTDQFILDDGQRDGLYTFASIKRAPNTTLSLTPADKLLVKCSVFRHTLNDGYLSVDSYPIDDANTANTTAITTKEIPYYFSEASATLYNLRDCVDFRPVLANTAVYSQNTGSASINPANTTTTMLSSTENLIAVPGTAFQTDAEYYLPRIDKLILDTSGNMTLLEGSPSDLPRGPADVNGAMTLATVSVAPYPSLSQIESSDSNRDRYKVSLRDYQIQRFTMKDLAKVAKRVENLEYYAALSLLEKQTNDLTIKDGAGLERFKNGIFVDDFDNTSIANMNDIEFSAVVDTPNSRIMPAATQQEIELEWNTGSNVTGTNEVASLSYTSNNLITQLKASSTRSLGGPSWDEQPPTPVIWPPYEPYYDVYVPPVPTTPSYTPVYYTSTVNPNSGQVEYYTTDGGRERIPDSVIEAQRANYTPQQLIWDPYLTANPYG